MARSKRPWLYFLGALVVCIVATTPLEAQCAKCCLTPSGPDCCHTFYNAANTCLWSGSNTCSHLGNCQGELGACGGPGEEVCPIERWACGRPLHEEWRLVGYTIERPIARPALLAGKTRKGKA